MRRETFVAIHQPPTHPPVPTNLEIIHCSTLQKNNNRKRPLCIDPAGEIDPPTKMAPGSTQHLPQQTQQQTFDVTVGRPPTSTRRPAIDADEFIAKPGVPRANAAVSTSSPQGNKAYTERHKEHVCRVFLPPPPPGGPQSTHPPTFSP